MVVENVKRDCIVVIKSTVPIGTCDRIKQYIDGECKYKVEVVSNPEFLSQGTAIQDMLFPKRIILGVSSNNASMIMKKLYSDFTENIIILDYKSSEMIKYAANNFLALRIAYTNEIANLCENLGADIEKVTLGMGYDPRIGSEYLNAGIGFGGSCFPKDTKALKNIGSTRGLEMKITNACIESNEEQKYILLKKLDEYFPSVRNLKISILGVTFKPNTDDIRESQAIANIKTLVSREAKIVIWDEIALDSCKDIFGDDCEYSYNISEALQDADICMIFTDWEKIKSFPLSQFPVLMKNPLIIDGRNCFNIEEISSLNLIYDSIGRKAINNLLPLNEEEMLEIEYTNDSIS